MVTKARLLIRLERPALVTPELRAWISQRIGEGRAVLSRARGDAAERGALLLRVDLPVSDPRHVEEEVADLMSDLRLLGLRPTMVSHPLAGS